MSGEVASVAEITTREALPKGLVSRVLPLAWLAPVIGAAILYGRHPPALTVNRLRALPEIPLDWAGQRALPGIPGA